MSEKNIKRVSLYFNLDNPVEKKMWEYLESSRSKSNTIKNLLEEKINNLGIPKINYEVVDKISYAEETKQKIEPELDKTELDTTGMSGF